MSLDSHVDQPQRLMPQTLEDLLRSWMRRVCGALVVGLAAAGWLALLTWSVSDPSFSHSTSAEPRNILGMPGAVLSDLMLHSIGLASIFFLIPVIVAGMQLMLADHIDRFRVRLFLGAISIPSIAAGLSALPPTASWQLPYGYGGAFGDVLFDLTAAILATAVPNGSSTAAGISFFILGFWSLTRAIGLDRRQLFELLWLSRHEGSPVAGVNQPAFSVRLAGVAAESIASMFTRNKPTQFTSQHTPIQRTEPSWNGVEAGWPSSGPPPVPHAATPHTPGLQAPGPNAATDAFVGDYDTTSSNEQVISAEQAEIESGRAMAIRFAHPGARATENNSDHEPPPAPPLGTGFAESDNSHALYSGLGASAREAKYRTPSLNLLTRPAAKGPSADHTQAALKGAARLLQDVLADFRVKGEVKGIRPGPIVTMYEFEPARGTKASRVIALADDIARSMSATSARIAVVPGRNVIGIELPNPRREQVALRDLLEAQAYRHSDAALPLTLGKGITGEPCVADLAQMPHLLVAGTTGSGKSVGVNAMILSLLFRHSPDECQFLMIDPKMLELSVYNGIPHLLTPVITDPQRAVAALNWAIGEMEERYKRMAELGVRNIEMFNNRVRNSARQGESLGHSVNTGFNPATGEPVYEEKRFEPDLMPRIVIVVDEFADLMAIAGKEIELAVRRLAQKARAAGLHLIMATQRPSVDVVTGTIKANFPTRISFKVASRIDSRTILNEHGAEQLLGQGDMLFSDGGGHIQRLHGPFVSDEEVHAVTQVLREQRPPSYIDGITDLPEDNAGKGDGARAEDNELYQSAVTMVIEDQRASTSYIQRRFSIGYNRAANILDRMEKDGVVSDADRSGRRQVLRADDVMEPNLI